MRVMPFGVMLQDDRLKHQTQDFTRYQWGEKITSLTLLMATDMPGANYFEEEEVK